MVGFVRYDISCGDPCTISLGCNGFRFATGAAGIGFRHDPPIGRFRQEPTGQDR